MPLTLYFFGQSVFGRPILEWQRRPGGLLVVVLLELRRVAVARHENNFKVLGVLDRVVELAELGREAAAGRAPVGAEI